MTPFIHQMQLEVERARRKHGPMNSLHEAYAVILEEVEEFWAMVRMQTSERDPALMLTELIQIAAMAERAAEDLGLIDATYDKATERPDWLRQIVADQLAAHDKG